MLGRKWEKVGKLVEKEWGNMGHQPNIGKTMGKMWYWIIMDEVGGPKVGNLFWKASMRGHCRM